MLLIGGMIYLSTFLEQCGPAVAPATTSAIIQVESGGYPLAIGDNQLRKSFAPKTRSEAVRLAAQLLDQGHSVDLGLMQINSFHLTPMGLSLDDVFDPCRNVRAGTTILADFYRKFDTGDPAYTLMKALSAYNTGHAWKGAGYVNKILVAAGVNYRVVFVPVEGAPAGTADPPPRKKKTKSDSRGAPFFFLNTSSALVPSRGGR
jgi:type IV secretion system protein VirB1